MSDGFVIKSITFFKISFGRVLTKYEYRVLSWVIPAISNSASAAANQAAGESSQKHGSFADTFSIDRGGMDGVGFELPDCSEGFMGVLGSVFCSGWNIFVSLT